MTGGLDQAGLTEAMSRSQTRVAALTIRHHNPICGIRGESLTDEPMVEHTGERLDSIG
jgi:hypothetical protein